MISLFKLIISSVLILLAIKVNAQDWKFAIDLPFISYNYISLNEIDNGRNKYNFNENNVPNIRLSSSYKNVFLGIESYYVRLNNKNKKPEMRLNAGDISVVKIQSYSFLLGYKKSISKVSILGGLGLTYNEVPFGLYHDCFPKPWEASVCYERNDWGFMMWSSIKYDVMKGINIGLNLRFNPMLNSFRPHEGTICFTPHTHDRIHYFVSQLSIGYQF